MKKTIALLLVLVLLLSLAACAGGKVSKDNPEKAPSGENKESNIGKDDGNDGKDDGNSGKPGSYSEGYEAYSALTDALSNAFDPLLEKYNETAGDGYLFEIFLPFLSIDMAFTATCGTEGWMAAMEYMLNDATAEEVGANAYRISYKSSYYLPDSDSYESVENVPHEMYCAFDPSTGGVQFYETAEYEGETVLLAFVEYQPLGGNRYAMQDLTERAIMEYDGKEVKTFTYSRTEENAYTPEADSIFGNASLSDGWVKENAASSAVFTLDASTLTLWYAATQTEYSSTEEKTIVIDR